MALAQTSKYDVKIPKSVNIKKSIFGLAEKESAAKNIAAVLDKGFKKIKFPVSKISKKKKEKQTLFEVEGYQVNHNGEQIIILSASGHLFTLVSDGYGWQFPVYDFTWVPLPSVENNNEYLKKQMIKIEATLEVMRLFVQQAKSHIIMTDYDDEGEVIGAKILDELSTNGTLSKARRMRYSTFSESEILQSYADAMNGKLPEAGINRGMYARGLMRHYLDWLWGINLSRALMLSLKNTTGRYYTLSTGRVQGPTLSFVADRQEQINLHVPIPSFFIDLKIQKQGIQELTHMRGSLEKETEAKDLAKNLLNSQGKVTDISTKKQIENAPTPYNLSKLTSDANSIGVKPSQTMRAAENLYLGAYISYPRTDSEKYPPDLDHKNTLNQLDSRYSKYIKILKSQNKKLIPKEGKKTDPAHPCIYPTGILPGKLRTNEAKIYMLIVHRYFATFGINRTYESSRVEFDFLLEKFSLNGNITLNVGWRGLLDPSIDRSKDNQIPAFKLNEVVKPKEVNYLTKYLNNPTRYSEASLIKEMEKHDIGTKATRSDIVENLKNRKFISEQPIEITLLGYTINSVLKSYSSQVISVDLSRKLEEMGDMIEQSYNRADEGESFLLSDALVRGITLLHEMLEELMEYQDKVGDTIFRNLLSQQKTETIVGECSVCKTGELRVIRSKKTGNRFIGCSNYFTDVKCTNSQPLIQKGRLTINKKPCPEDGFKQILIRNKGKPFERCLNPDCPLNKQRDKQYKEYLDNIDSENSTKKTKKGKSSTKKTTKKGPKKSTKKATTKSAKKTTKKSSKKSTKKTGKRGKK